MLWSEFLQEYETHDSSFEKIEYDILLKQCKLYLEVRPISSPNSEDKEGIFKRGWLIGEEVIQFALKPNFHFANRNFNGEVLSLSVEPYEVQLGYKRLSIAFLVFDHSSRDHTFHMLEMIALNIKWSESVQSDEQSDFDQIR